MSTQYQVSIEMPQKTVEALASDNYFLYGFKSVQAAIAGGVPLVWFATADYGLDTELLWAEQYQAYATTVDIVPGGRVSATNAYGIGLAQTLDVTGEKGTGSVDTQVGLQGAISIANKTLDQFTAGISQVQPDGTVTPMCAFNLFGEHTDVIVPIERVLVMFSSKPVDTGTVIEQAYSGGLIIDLTANNHRTVRYDINKGWSWDDGNWATRVAPMSSLAELLILTPELGPGGAG